MDFHKHQSMEIMYMIEGTCRIEFDEHAKRIETIFLKKGEFVLLDANIMHRLDVDAHHSCRMLNVEFSFEHRINEYPSMIELVAEEQSLKKLLVEEKKYVVLADPDEVFHIMKTLVLEMDTTKPSHIMVHLLFCQLLIWIARVWRDTYQSQQHQVKDYIKEMVTYLHQHLDQDFHVQDIASSVNLHPTYVQRIFKLHTEIPIIDISHYVGIGSRQYFHFLFKRYTHQTPSTYRKTMHTHRSYESDK
jgi:AraC-like DNA-binding protein